VQYFNNFSDLFSAWREMPSTGRIYSSKIISEDTIRASSFYVISSKEVVDYIEEDDDIIPIQLKGLNFSSWLEAPIFSGIINSATKDGEKSITPEQAIEAVLYYVEYDAFMNYEELLRPY